MLFYLLMKKLLILPSLLRLTGILLIGGILLSTTGMVPVGSEIVQDSVQTTAQVTPSSSDSIVGTWVSVVPPLLAIGFALIFRQVLLALFMGIWMGAWLVGERS